MPLVDSVALARQIAGGLDEEESLLGESPREIARRLAGLPPEEEEGLDIMQPIRTAFGASEGSGGFALGGFLPESYKEAKVEKAADFGVTEDSPWYEKAEALPGGGDVLAQLVPDPIRNSLVGSALGPIGRMAGNILFDPTTYTPYIAGKAAVGTIRGIEGGAAMWKATQTALKARNAAVKAGKLTKELARSAHMADASRIADLVLSKGTTAQKVMYKGGIGVAAGGDLAMGTAAALAYGPDVLKATVEGVQRTYEAEGAGQKAAEAANTALMAALTALMGKGVIDAAAATRAYTRHLKATKQVPADIENIERGISQEAGVEQGLMTPEAEGGGLSMLDEGDEARILDDEVPVPEPEIPDEFFKEDLAGDFAEFVPPDTPSQEPLRGDGVVVTDDAATLPFVDDGSTQTQPFVDLPTVEPRKGQRTLSEANLEPDSPQTASKSEVTEPIEVKADERLTATPSVEPASPKPEPEAAGAPSEPATRVTEPPVPAKPVETPVEPLKAPEPTKEAGISRKSAVDRDVREQMEGLETAIRQVDEGGGLKNYAEGKKTKGKGYDQADIIDDYLDGKEIDPTGEYVLNKTKLEQVRADFRKSAEREFDRATPEPTTTPAPVAPVAPAAAAPPAAPPPKKPEAPAKKGLTALTADQEAKAQLVREAQAKAVVDRKLAELKAKEDAKKPPAPVKAAEPVKAPPPKKPTVEPAAEKPTPEVKATVEEVPADIRAAWENPEFKEKLDSEYRREQTRVAAGKLDDMGGTPMERAVEGMLNRKDFQDDFTAAIREHIKENGSPPTGGQTMGIVRKLLKKTNKKGEDVYAIKNQKEGAGGGSRETGALVNATETAEAAGKAVGETKKEKARVVGAANRLDAIREKIEADGNDFHTFVFQTNTLQSQTKQTRDIFIDYLAEREPRKDGSKLSRAVAIKNVQKNFAGKLGAGRVGNLIGEVEGKLGEEVGGKERQKASPEQVKEIRRLQKEAKNFPKGGSNQKPAEFLKVLQSDPKEAGLALGRFLRFIKKRDETKLGLPASVRSIKELKDFANSIGVTVAPTDDAIKLATRVANELGLLKEIKSYIKEAPRAPRAGPFRLEGFKQTAKGEWTHPNGMLVRTTEPEAGKYVVELSKEHPADAKDIVQALRSLLEDERIAAFDVSEGRRIKGTDPVQEAMSELGLVQVNVEDILESASKDYEGVLYAAPGSVDTMATRMEEIIRGYIPHEVDNDYSRNMIEEALNKQAFAIKLRNQLKGKAEGIDFYSLTEPDYREGTYHQVFKLNRVTTPDRNGVMLRIGRSPNHSYPTSAQQALTMPVIAKGILAEDSSGAMYYTVHPEARVAPYNAYTVPRYDRTGLLSSSEPLLKSLDKTELRNDFSEALAARIELEQTLTLPPGMGLQDNLDSIADLFARSQRAGLIIEDVTKGTGSVRFDQWGWIPVKNATDDMVTYRDMNGDDWRLVYTDYGTVFPNPESRAGTVWEFYDEHPFGDTVRLSLKETQPDSQLSMADIKRRQADYEDDLIHALELEDGLLNVNNDRVASDEYLARHGELGLGAAKALKRVVADIQESINSRTDMPFEGKLDVEYVGLTSSPQLSGLHLRSSKGKGRILSNVVEAVHASSSYDDAIEKLYHTVTHEVVHNKNQGHGGSFLTIGEYMENLLAAEKKTEAHKAWIKEGFTEEAYKAIRSELSPEFKRMRNEHGGRESWRQASIERVSPGTTESGAAPRTNRSGRGAEDSARGIADGVRPRSSLQRGDSGKTGRVRQAAKSDGSAPKGRAKEQAAGPDLGRGTEGAEAEYERLVDQVDEFWTRKEGGEKDVAAAKALLDELVNLRKKGGRPLSDLHTTAWTLAEDLHSHLSQDEKDLLRNSLPSPTKPGQMKGVFNMLHNPDISNETKEITALYGQIADGAWAKDRIRKWADVDDEVKELLGIDTPENWTLAFRNKGGGITDKDAMLLRQIHTDLAGKVDRERVRFADAVADGDTDAIAAAMKSKHDAQEIYMNAGLNLSRGMTGAARALAIGRNTVLKSDPRAAAHAALKAGLRERLRTKFKDPVEAEEKAGELFNKMMEIVKKGDDGDWGEFYRAYRLMTGSKLWPDKVLEFYKAGLLGWSSRIANITSNALFRAVRSVEDAVAGGLDAAKSKLTGSKREIYAGEVAVSQLALRRATAEAFPKWIKANQRAFTLQPQDFKAAIAKGSIMEDLMMHPGAIEGKFGELVRFQLKGLGADDDFAKALSRTDTYYRQVYRRLRKGEFKRNTGESYAQATERIVSDLRGNFQQAMDGHQFDSHKLALFQPMAEEAEKIALRDTFQSDLKATGRGIQAFLRENPAFQVFFPFFRTPTNIAKETIKRTPAGYALLARDWKKLTPLERMTEFSKPTVGTAMGLGIMSLAMTGEITGGGPTDWNERQMKMAAGWAPYSIRIGDQWVSYQRFEPIAAIFGIAADAAEGVRNGDFDTFHGGALKVLQSSAENITNKTFLSGMDALFSAISNPKQGLDNLLKQLQGSVIPNSLGYVPVGRLARGIDGTFRQTESMTMDVFYAKIPFMSQKVQPQYTPTGEERRRPGTAFERVISPFARRSVEDGPVQAGADEVVRVGATPQPPKKYWYGKGGVRVAFEQEEKQHFAKALAKATEVIGTKLVKDPNYLRLPDDEMDPRYVYGRKTKQEVVRSIYRKYRAAAMKSLRRGVETRARKSVKDR